MQRESWTKTEIIQIWLNNSHTTLILVWSHATRVEQRPRLCKYGYTALIHSYPRLTRVLCCLQLESLKRDKDEALLAVDSYRIAYEEQLSQNSSLLFELLENSGWLRRKLGWCVKNNKKSVQQPSPENSLSPEEEILIRQLRTHKDEQVQRLVHMVSELPTYPAPNPNLDSTPNAREGWYSG